MPDGYSKDKRQGSTFPNEADLKESRARILSATNSDILAQEILLLEATLALMSERTSGEVKCSVDRTLEELKAYKLHDKTRADVARGVQTIICNLNHQ